MRHSAWSFDRFWNWAGRMQVVSMQTMAKYPSRLRSLPATCEYVCKKNQFFPRKNAFFCQIYTIIVVKDIFMEAFI